MSTIAQINAEFRIINLKNHVEANAFMKLLNSNL